MSTLYVKISRDMAEAQDVDGCVPDIAPEYVRFASGFRDSPEWGLAFVMVPVYLYDQYK
jgi:alpha-L-rhamnosidase